MKKRRIAILIICALLILSACSKERFEPSPAPLPPVVGAGERSTEAEYTLDLTFDGEKQTVSGHETVKILNTSGETWNELFFQDWASAADFTSEPMGGVTKLTDASVSIEDGEYRVEPERAMNDPCDIRFALPKSVESGSAVTLEMDILVHVPTVYDRFGVNETSCNLGNFFPILASFDGGWVIHPYFGSGESFASECASFDVTLSHDSAYTVVCTGESVTEDGVTRASVKNVRDFCICLGVRWDELEKEHNGVLIRSYFTEGHGAGGRAALNAAADALDAFGNTIGAYPYTTLDVVEADFWAGGMEYPQLVMIATGLYDWGDSDALKTVVAHEVAHQWFYGVVGNDSYDEAWLDESFASFLERVYLEHLGKRSTYQKGVDAEPIGGSVAELGDSYYSSVYVAGAEFLSLLREEMGEAEFYAALQEIYAEEAYTLTDTETVLGIFREHGGAGIEPLITQFFE